MKRTKTINPNELRLCSWTKDLLTIDNHKYTAFLIDSQKRKFSANVQFLKVQDLEQSQKFCHKTSFWETNDLPNEVILTCIQTVS